MIAAGVTNVHRVQCRDCGRQSRHAHTVRFVVHNTASKGHMVRKQLMTSKIRMKRHSSEWKFRSVYTYVAFVRRTVIRTNGAVVAKSGIMVRCGRPSHTDVQYQVNTRQTQLSGMNVSV